MALAAPYRFQEIVGHAYQEDRYIALGPVVDSLRASPRRTPQMWEAAARRADVLAAVVPELGGERSSIGPTSLDRALLFETLLDVAEEAGLNRPTLWVLEDLHWADEGMWDFVQYAARRLADMAMVLVVTLNFVVPFVVATPAC